MPPNAKLPAKVDPSDSVRPMVEIKLSIADVLGMLGAVGT